MLTRCSLYSLKMFSTLLVYSQTIILGAWNAKTPDFVIINHIILLFKRYIYLKGQDIFGMKNFIKHIERIEHNIAFNIDKLDTHYKKWDKLLPVLKVGIVRLLGGLPQT